uniref:Uncharacterized protein n=1 Tax=Elphidium margaritaceum TaxID=933848 RepID=A0A7S0TCZ1_9EUKA
MEGSPQPSVSMECVDADADGHCEHHRDQREEYHPLRAPHPHTSSYHALYEQSSRGTYRSRLFLQPSYSNPPYQFMYRQGGTHAYRAAAQYPMNNNHMMKYNHHMLSGQGQGIPGMEHNDSDALPEVPVDDCGSKHTDMSHLAHAETDSVAAVFDQRSFRMKAEDLKQQLAMEKSKECAAVKKGDADAKSSEDEEDDDDDDDDDTDDDSDDDDEDDNAKSKDGPMGDTGDIAADEFVVSGESSEDDDSETKAGASTAGNNSDDNEKMDGSQNKGKGKGLSLKNNIDHIMANLKRIRTITSLNSGSPVID